MKINFVSIYNKITVNKYTKPSVNFRLRRIMLLGHFVVVTHIAVDKIIRIWINILCPDKLIFSHTQYPIRPLSSNQ